MCLLLRLKFWSQCCNKYENKMTCLLCNNILTLYDYECVLWLCAHCFKWCSCFKREPCELLLLLHFCAGLELTAVLPFLQSWGLGKVLTNRSSLQPMINEVCEIVRSDQFSADLTTLGLRSEGTEASAEGAGNLDGSKPIKSRYAQVWMVLVCTFRCVL